MIPPEETVVTGDIWERTTGLAFVEFEGKKLLHQLWISHQTGRREWRAIPEISQFAADTGQL